MENKREPKKKIQKFREVITYIIFGLMLGADGIAGFFLIKYKNEFFNFAIDFSRSIELGLLVLKFILLIVVLVINLRTLKSVTKWWRKETFIEKEPTEEGIEKIKRIGWFKKVLFYWRANGARKWMDKYHEEFKRLQKTIGKIRGNETRELMKLKEEMIKGVLIWTDDFQITQVHKNKKGERVITNLPVTEEFLNSLYMKEIYEDYLLKCVDTAERFINGYSEIEQGVEL